MKIYFGLLATTALIASISTAHAEASGDSGNIIVTAARAERPLAETGNSVTVIDQQEITRRQSVSVVDLLRNVPGVTFTRNGGIGATTSVYIRGAESDQTVALIDGVKLNDPSSPGSGFNFGNLLVGNIARIEIVRGSQSVLWGSQAIGGVVNMITRKPADALAVNARAEGGSLGTAQLVANVSGKFGPVAASVGAGYFRTDGISTFDENLGGKERDGYRNFGANASFNIELAPNVSVDLRGWYSDGKTGIDGFPPPTYSFGDTSEYAKTKEFVGYAGLNAALFDGRWTNRIAYTRTDTKRDNFDPGGFTFQTFDAKGTNERLEYQGGLNLGSGWTADFGAEEEKSSFRTSSYGGPFSTAHARIDSVYGQLTAHPVMGLTLAAGVRHDSHDRFGGHTSFAANGAYSPNGGDTVLRASYGEGFKAPSLYQLYSDYGNQTLRPESSKSWDAGITQKLLDGKVEASATWFHRDTDNLIVFISCTAPLTGICTDRPFGTYDNVQKARAQGVETSLTLRPVEALSVQAGYSWIDAVNRVTGKVLPRRPSQSVFTAVDFRWTFGLETGATITHVGDSFDNASNSRQLNGYVLVDLRASYPVAKGVELYARIENLFDEKYETIYRYGTQPRVAYAGVRLQF
ncbi:MAG: TonB-dependent receptor [Novosphingobium sp.]